MAHRAHIPLMIAGLAVTGVAGAWAQDNSGNPWRVPPRAPPSTNAAEDEGGYTQGYLRGFEQGYRRGAEQATGGAPTANLGTAPSATGSTGRGTGILSDTPSAAVPTTPRPSAAPPPGTRPAAALDQDSERAFTPKSSQWGEYPPLDIGRPAASRPTANAHPQPAPGAPPGFASHYPYASPPAYAQPPGYAQPYAAAPQPYPYGGYGYASPYAGGPSTLMPGGAGPGAYGPSTLGPPFGAAPLPGMPGLGVPGFGAW